MDNPLITTSPDMNAKVVEILRVGGRPIGLYAAQRIEELEQQVAALEFQNKTAGIRAVIESYDRREYGLGAMDANEVYSAIRGLLGGYETMPEYWMFRIAVIWGEWDEEIGGMGGDPDYYINKIRSLIGMAMPT